eukprot:gnl/MRDRNA2_/MRDRNA2_141758_c0_seq1.p1 gnl/MRDRNA2_/MRDRNA2_141758_c0~~gnl/MRDRNA2_/MRDRNA2_141758_c0_seq1.p1  ORF type:complete len:139 (+),score=26.09 gnl/MRDRNA2_/MRDRNA2_141758_c0_seq1:55-471(+)
MHNDTRASTEARVEQLENCSAQLKSMFENTDAKLDVIIAQLGIEMPQDGHGAQKGKQYPDAESGSLADDPNDPLGQFVAKWKLDAGAEHMLRKASPQLQQAALANFNPGEGLPNVSGKFVAYLKKLPAFTGIGRFSPY